MEKESPQEAPPERLLLSTQSAMDQALHIGDQREGAEAGAGSTSAGSES